MNGDSLIGACHTRHSSLGKTPQVVTCVSPRDEWATASASSPDVATPAPKTDVLGAVVGGKLP